MIDWQFWIFLSLPAALSAFVMYKVIKDRGK
jgi:hypothetical protein